MKSEFCNKSHNCCHEGTCWLRYGAGTFRLLNNLGMEKMFCLGYKRKWWKFWAKKEEV